MATEKTLVFDVDGVVAHGGHPYNECRAFPDAVRYLQQLKRAGYTLYYLTARYMTKYDLNQQKAREAGELELKHWLNENKIPFDGVFFGKPPGKIYADDLAVRVESANGSGDWVRLMEHLKETDPNTLRVGDVVELNSGSPAMTVMALSTDGKAQTAFFNEEGEAVECEYQTACLRVTERRWEGIFEDTPVATDEEDDDEEEYPDAHV